MEDNSSMKPITRKTQRTAHCLQCKAQYPVRRWWQRFCSAGCRDLWHAAADQAKKDKLIQASRSGLE